MLCLPEFDTYHILEQYAREPESAQNRSALNILKRRARIQMHWRAANSRYANENNVDGLLKLLMGQEGMSSKQKPVQKKTLGEMSEQELMTFYNSALEQVGMALDPEALVRAQQQEDGD